MLGIDYASSDDEDQVPTQKPKLAMDHKAPTPEPLTSHAPPEQPQVETPPVHGPSQGPSVTPPPRTTQSQATDDDTASSPYTFTRATIQNLTLPPVPNFDIPPSPPGSPPQKAAKKFAQFLELKQQGQHFNQRLENSSVLRDPGHLRKLMDFAGISEESTYASTLPEHLAVPCVFPEWAYAEELRSSQKRLARAKEHDKSKKLRDTVDFVSVAGPGASGAKGAPSGIASSKRKDLEHRGRDESSSGSRWTSRSRSPKRRRSRSKGKR